MKRIATLLRRGIPALLCIPLLACTPIEQSARNTAAALNGALTAAQAKYQASCTANPKQTVCTTINQAIAGQNALITATEAYCSWPPGTITTPPLPTTACTPVKTATAALQTAIANANLFVAQLKGAL
jgi:hypothetical protein